jgi:2-polyprenyl-6-methoxyphenol hydroxylase-like FAD-dependent oxidoreductase
MTVLIAGGGIGGLTLALSLHQIGVPARVFESVTELKPLGVGINVLPHAVRELIELGLHDRLDASGVRTRELAYFSKHGKPIWSEPRGIEAGYKWPQFSIHRGTLQQILLDTAIERLGAENILTSHHLTGWSETADGIRVEFIDNATGKPAGAYEGALLIAADGIHSAAREKLYPREGPPIWNGRILWRGITTADAFLTGRTMIMAGHEILKFVCYPISKAPTPTASIRSTGWPNGTCRRPISGGAKTITAPRNSTSSCRASRTGNSTGSTCPALSRIARTPMNTRSSTAIRSRNGLLAAPR